MRNLCSILFLVVAVASCSLPHPSISLSQAELTYGAEGGQDTIQITSNYNWIAATTSESVAITPSSGSKDIPAVIYVAQNTDGTDKTMTVTFSTYNASEVAQADVVIRQGFATPAISVSPAQATITYKEDTLAVNLTSNFIWSSFSDNRFIRITPNAGQVALEPVEVSIAVPSNPTEIDTTYLIGFCCASSILTDTTYFTIRQAGEPVPVLDLSIHNKEIGASGGSFEATITSNFLWGASVSDGVSIYPPYSEEGESIVSIGIPENATGKTIRHFVAIDSHSSSRVATDTLFITQLPNN